MDTAVAILGVLQAVAGFVLVLFIPGYALCWALYPRRDELTLMGRMAISLTLSLSATILTVLFIDLVLGIDTTPINIALSLIVLTGLAAAIWKIETVFPKWAADKEFGKKAMVYRNLFIARAAQLRLTLVGQQRKVLRFIMPASDNHEER
ncbi:DUF1616 domain-containing protein [Methanocalculus sp.]|uniref:DUF1616 domain-containing protein n=1 Tax=Methanocalculus sp. TaxID=2004547 RepID=UPI00262F5F5D|nr:DUF1616 domain-containing protein [Methanocalculus sp.]MDG6251439.1 DUF1616 domain-containing protein [Methanocalculus sp.]